MLTGVTQETSIQLLWDWLDASLAIYRKELLDRISWKCDNGSYNKNQPDALFLKFIFVQNPTCFGQIYCPSLGV